MEPHLTKMGKKAKLYKKAKNAPQNLTFNEICCLAKYVGFRDRNHEGSHKTMRHPTNRRVVNFQPDKNKKAKPYQVKQLIDIIDEFDLMED